MPSSAAVPVEALLKLSLDKAGASTIQDFLDKQESSFSRIEGYAGKISSHFDGLTRGALGLAGLAGVSAIVHQFLGTTQSGAQVGLAAGQVTGGMSVGHNYGQALLSAQAKTGVGEGDIAQGLVMAIQQVGGNPSPQQAAVLGGLLAGYGNTVGMSPAQVAGIVAPILQASNKPLTQGAMLASMAGLTQGLSAFPGSQSGPMLSLLSSLGVSQAIGLRPGQQPDMHGLVAAVNAAAQTDSIFRNPAVAGSAISGVSGGLQNAYGNPAMEAFLQRAGIGYWDQRKGFTPQNMQAITREATSLYGTGITRDLALRSMFGLTSAKLLEEMAPGTTGAKLLQRDLQEHVHPNEHQLRNQINNAQLSHTPSSELQKLSAEALKWLFASPLHVGLGAAGLYGAKKLSGMALRGLGRGAGSLWSHLRSGKGTIGDAASAAEEGGWTSGDEGWFGAAADAAGGEAGGAGLAGALGAGALRVLGGTAGALGFALLDPAQSGGAGDRFSVHQAEQIAVRNVLQMALHKFGASKIHSPAARSWMRAQLLSPTQGRFFGQQGQQIWGAATLDAAGGRPLGSLQSGATSLLDQVLGTHGGGSKTVDGKDPLSAFSDATKTLLQAAQSLERATSKTGFAGPGFASYSPGALGTPAIQALGAGAPGLEYASLTGASAAGGSSLASYTPVNLYTGSGSGSGGSGGGDWKSAVASWYDPGAGGTNGSWGGGAWQGHPVEPGTYGFAHKTMAFGTQVAFRYRGKTTTATCVDRGPFVAGRDFDLLPGPARALGMTGSGVVTLQYRVVGVGSGSNNGSQGGSGGGSGGQWASATLGASGAGGSGGGSGSGGSGGGGGSSGGGGAQMATFMHHLHHAHHLHRGDQPVHVHVHVDGQEVRRARALRGHR